MADDLASSVIRGKRLGCGRKIKIGLGRHDDGGRGLLVGGRLLGGGQALCPFSGDPLGTLCPLDLLGLVLGTGKAPPGADHRADDLIRAEAEAEDAVKEDGKRGQHDRQHRANKAVHHPSDKRTDKAAAQGSGCLEIEVSARIQADLLLGHRPGKCLLGQGDDVQHGKDEKQNKQKEEGTAHKRMLTDRTAPGDPRYEEEEGEGVGGIGKQRKEQKPKGAARKAAPGGIERKPQKDRQRDPDVGHCDIQLAVGVVACLGTAHAVGRARLSLLLRGGKRGGLFGLLRPIFFREQIFK